MAKERLDEIRKSVPISMRTPCSICHWRLGNICTLNVNAKDGKCYQYRREVTPC